MRHGHIFLTAIALATLTACGGSGSDSDTQNQSLVFPSSYAKSPSGVLRPEEIGVTNHWLNLFEDRSEAVSQISDQEVIDYIYTDNYSTLIEQLRTESWDGPIPAIQNLHLGAGAFDDQGFARDDSHWVAFNYKPLPSTFWPTNGSTDDVMVRLPATFREQSCNGSGYSRDTYIANLAILEAVIQDLDQVSLPQVDENSFCTDLNRDGQLGLIDRINRPDSYVGNASDVSVAPMLYPEGTEFLHTVRYIGIDKDMAINIPARMKEVRYMVKQTFAFPRKVTGAAGWGYVNLKGMVDAPNVGGTEGEILNYLKLAGGGNEFRENPEIIEKWFNKDGSVNEEKVLAADVYELITPSPERALTLNKAYMAIVRDQDFIHGRDANVTPAVNVYDSVDPDTAPVLPTERQYDWDIRLAW